jgi:hypothetical protein
MLFSGYNSSSTITDAPPQMIDAEAIAVDKDRGAEDDPMLDRKIFSLCHQSSSGWHLLPT